MSSVPLGIFHRWYAAARRREPLPDAMALATASRGGAPSVRFVLLKGADERGFVFYTNLRSPKARDLKRNPRGALAFYWDRTGRQIRITGRVQPVPASEADAYFRSRPRLSQLGAWASAQSRPIASRALLVGRVARLALRYRRAIPRPDDWSGYRLVPRTIEFWARGAGRLHDRQLWTRRGARWSVVRLQP